MSSNKEACRDLLYAVARRERPYEGRFITPRDSIVFSDILTSRLNSPCLLRGHMCTACTTYNCATVWCGVD